MTKKPYMPRVCDTLLRRELESAGAVLIEGPKWCGKSRTAEQAAKSVLYMQDQDHAASYRMAAQTMPSTLLEGETPRLIDEWQVAPVLWDAVRFAVDQRGGMGHFILTGSATPPEDPKDELLRKHHTGTGRITRLRMRPMSLWESGESTGTISLSALFNGELPKPTTSRLSIPDIARLICRGGWPEAIHCSDAASLRIAQNYVNAVIEEDVPRVDGVERNPERVRLLMQSLARNVSTLATQETLIADIHTNDCTASDKTVAAYLNALQRIFVVENVLAWSPNMRSKTAIRTSAKRQFVDPSIAAACLRTSPDGLLKDFLSFGFLFESLCTRDIRVYSQPLDGRVAHFRDRTGLEADLIVSLPDGRWAPIEVKLGEGQVEEAAKHLSLLSKKVDEAKMGAPSFRMILTGTQFAYVREDKTLVCPLGCLRP